MRAWSRFEEFYFKINAIIALMKTTLFLLLFSVHLFAGSIRVAVAANVGFAMPELVAAFRAHHPDTRVETLIGGSGKLAAQIQRGKTLARDRRSALYPHRSGHDTAQAIR